MTAELTLEERVARLEAEVYPSGVGLRLADELDQLRLDVDQLVAKLHDRYDEPVGFVADGDGFPSANQVVKVGGKAAEGGFHDDSSTPGRLDPVLRITVEVRGAGALGSRPCTCGGAS